MCSIAIPANEAKARARIYAFLAELFSSHPTEESIRTLQEMAAELGIFSPSGLSLNDLDREYMELFVVPNPRYVAPYESVFRDEWTVPPVLKRGSNPAENGTKIKGLLMGESTLEVRRAYIKAGVLPQEDLPDHIANELRFLAYLCEQEAAAVNGDGAAPAELRTAFCREHPLQWIGELRDRINQRERIGFYRAAIEITEALLRSEIV